jgi:hypothetical protein
MQRTLLVGFLTVLAASAFAAVKVKGYTKKDGSYVAPSYRTAPDSRKDNNWSSKPNVNPYTGGKGYKDPYAPNTPKKNDLWKF